MKSLLKELSGKFNTVIEQENQPVTVKGISNILNTWPFNQLPATRQEVDWKNRGVSGFGNIMLPNYDSIVASKYELLSKAEVEEYLTKFQKTFNEEPILKIGPKQIEILNKSYQSKKSDLGKRATDYFSKNPDMAEQANDGTITTKDPDEAEKLAKKGIDVELKDEMDEINVTAATPGYMSPKAFSKKQKKNMKYETVTRRLDKKYEELIESYRQYTTNDPKISPEKKVKNTIKDVYGKLKEIEQLVNYSSRLKKESGLSRQEYGPSVDKALTKISEMITKISERIRALGE